MNSDNVGWLLGIPLATLILCAAISIARPRLRRNPFLVVALATSATVLFVEVSFIALFLSALANMPDMREF